MLTTAVATAAHPASPARPPGAHPTTGSEGGHGPERAELPDQAVGTLGGVAPAALTVRTTSPSPSPTPGGPPMEAAGPAGFEAAAAPERRGKDRASRGKMGGLVLPSSTCESPPTAPSKRTTAEKTPGGKNSNGKLRGAPGASRLKAPGWGHDAAVTPIPPAAMITAGAAKACPSFAAATSSAATAANTTAAPRLHAPAPSAAALPWDLLTPVTEAATADELSVFSRGTRDTTRLTPASSATSAASRPDRGKLPSGPGRGGFRLRGSPHYLPAEPRRHPATGPAGGGQHRIESPPVDAGGPGGNRNLGGREKRAVWGGDGGDGSGARSAPGKISASSRGKPSTPGGPLSSASAYRCSPLSGAGDHVGARGSSFSSASGDMAAAAAGGGGGGRQAGGGYVAAMGRRARAMARYEAARRRAALATERARPSTPISERARWGKGKESRSERERRELLQRRAEYAEELKRKAKVISRDRPSFS